MVYGGRGEDFEGYVLGAFWTRDKLRERGELEEASYDPVGVALEKEGFRAEGTMLVEAGRKMLLVSMDAAVSYVKTGGGEGNQNC